jgi:hypothetical protein
MFAVLVSEVAHHVSEEEGTMFPRAQASLGTDKAVEIDARFRDTHAKIAAQI